MTKTKILSAAFSVLLALTMLPGCFTGIERTAEIKDSSSRKISPHNVPESALLGSVRPEPPRVWSIGKTFMVADGHPELAYTPASVALSLHRGDTLRLQSITGAGRLSGDSITEVRLLTPDGNIVTNIVETPLSSVMAAKELALPFTVELAPVDSVANILRGRKLWVLTTTRYTLEGDLKNGKKFVPVTIADVRPGSADYPIHVIFDEPDGSQAMLLMVYDSKTTTARTFDNLFSLSDPRKKHPLVTDKTWEQICNGQVAIDMTREECRLSLGAPASVDREVTYGGLVERWIYENGIYLFFLDGKLTQFRR